MGWFGSGGRAGVYGLLVEFAHSVDETPVISSKSYASFAITRIERRKCGRNEIV
jgi:hypothetical protein